jgi:hypothetical protein
VSNTFHHARSPKHHAWEAGDVVRLGDYAFADATILGFNDDGYARLARPYVYATGTGSTCTTPLTGVEIIDQLDLTRFGAGYTKVAIGRVL